jgi:hypothetical protein
MKGETLMSLRDLAITMALFSAAVVAVVVLGYIWFKCWSRKEGLRRGNQIAMAQLDPTCEELHPED